MDSESAPTASRKRSADLSLGGQPAPKQAKSNHSLTINYLARQNQDDLPLVANNDTLPDILRLLAEYQGVLERHESMAGNMGARPLGPILIRKFERLFDAPPKILKAHTKEGSSSHANVTWLDVVEFARSKPEQFKLDQSNEGVRVCQFYTKQCRVQISEEDFYVINSGMAQRLIPPQPIIEDEEKELGTLEILHKSLSEICNLADTVAARTRQLNHRIKSRKNAILDRRASEHAYGARSSSPSNVALMNGSDQQTASAALASMAQQAGGSTSGFTAVNSRPQSGVNGQHDHGLQGASQAIHNELRSKFFTLSDRNGRASNFPNPNTIRRPATTTPTQSTPQPAPSALPKHPRPPNGHGPSHPHTDEQYASLLISTQTSVAPHTPTQQAISHQHHGQGSGHGHGHTSRTPQERDDGGPFKAEMVSRMEGLAKGERVMPPCDRCRRLHMDCLKNLTACQGCTRKHAKCSWKEVREEELHATEPPPRPTSAPAEHTDHGNAPASAHSTATAPSTAPHSASVPGFNSINMSPNMFVDGLADTSASAPHPTGPTHESPQQHDNARPASSQAPTSDPAPGPSVSQTQESSMSQNDIEQLLLQRTARLNESPSTPLKREDPGLQIPEELSRPPSVPPGEGPRDDRKDGPVGGQGLDALVA